MVFTRKTKRRLLKLFQRDLNSYLEEKFGMDENKKKHAEFSSTIMKLCCTARRARDSVECIGWECLENSKNVGLAPCLIHIENILEGLEHLYFMVNDPADLPSPPLPSPGEGRGGARENILKIFKRLIKAEGG
jgi:hypothetical protein